MSDIICCSMCGIIKNGETDDRFYRVIKRRSYGPGCDENGYEYFYIITKMCITCRNIKQDQFRRSKNKK